MFTTLEALDTAQHADLFYRGVEGYAFARDVSWAPLACSEMVKAAHDMPVMFTTGDTVRPIALMGLARHTNALINDAGEWTGQYVPAHLRRYPFLLGDTAKAARFVVMIDRAAANFSHADAPAEGAQAMFEAGKPVSGGIVEQARRFLLAFQDELEQSQRWLAPLKEHDLLVERQLVVRREGQQEIVVNGFAVVDNDRLKAVDDSTLAAWARNGLLAMVYAHLHSQGNSERLMASLFQTAAQTDTGTEDAISDE